MVSFSLPATPHSRPFSEVTTLGPLLDVPHVFLLACDVEDHGMEWPMSPGSLRGGCQTPSCSMSGVAQLMAPGGRHQEDVAMEGSADFPSTEALGLPCQGLWWQRAPWEPGGQQP